MVHSYLKRFWLLCVVVALLAGCASTTPAATPIEELSAYWPTEGWRSSTPEQQGMDSDRLARMMDVIRQREYGIDSVLTVRNGYMVADAYVHPFRPGSQHIIHSCTKSIVSALVGIAIDKGYIEGADQPILELFPERTAATLDTNKKAMTLENLLTMTSGFNCQDSYLYGWRGLNEMRRSEDWVQFVLDLPMREEPGTNFEYCNSASFLLSAIIQGTTGQSALAFAEEHLFGPLGISDVRWPSNPQGISIGWGELRMIPRDMAKIGYLYLNDGLWDGQQIVPAAWVRASASRHTRATLSDGYGYQWWVDAAGFYMALGYAGQFIYVVPEKDMVVVFTSDLAESDFFVPESLLKQYIIPAAQSSTPLPENANGVALLESRIKALANP
jgi:CubicO group peptidase (beta-lactamase class C family)